MSDEIAGSTDATTLFHHWFVRYNPLYFFSALCILLGMYLATRGAESRDEAQLALVGVMQLYELALIGGAALLFRVAGQRRAAVILALIAAFFAFDPTLRTEGLAAFGTLWMAGAWAGMVLAKLVLLALALRLRVPAWAFAVPAVGAVALAVTPHLLAAPGADTQTVLSVTGWIGFGLVVAALWLRPAVRCGAALDAWGETVLRRSVRAATWLWAGFYHYHLLTWTGIHELALTMDLAVPYLAIAPLVARSERWTWGAATLAIGIAAIEPAAVSTTALLVGATLAWRAWREARVSLWVGALLAAYVGVWTHGLEDHVLPEPSLALGIGFGAALLGLALLRRSWAAGAGALACAAPPGLEHLPETTFEWGAAILVLGFAALVAGIAINWLRPATPAPHPPAWTPPAPASPGGETPAPSATASSRVMRRLGKLALAAFLVWLFILVAMPVPHGYTTRDKVRESVNLSNPARTAIGIACSEGDLAGADNATLGLEPPSAYSGSYTASVTAAGVSQSLGTVIVVLEEIGSTIEAGAVVVFTGRCVDGRTTWSVGGTIDEKYLPRL